LTRVRCMAVESGRYNPVVTEDSYYNGTVSDVLLVDIGGRL